MGRDKKALDGGLTFVLDGPAGVEVVHRGPGRGVPSRRARRMVQSMTTPRAADTSDCCCANGATPTVGPFHALNADPDVMATIGPVMTAQQSPTSS